MADTPYIKYGLQEDAKRLYFSEPKAARKIPRTVQAGYGILTHGLLMAANTSAGSLGKIVPYNPTAITGTEVAPGRAYLVADSGAANKLIEVTIEDSYKFAVGDDLMIDDDTTTAENLGAVASIDRTTYTNKAVITVTTDIGATSFTTARFAYAYVEGGDAAIGVLEKSIDTLVGENAKDANTVMILGNVILYAGVLSNLDAASKVDLSATAIGQYVDIP